MFSDRLCQWYLGTLHQTLFPFLMDLSTPVQNVGPTCDLSASPSEQEGPIDLRKWTSFSLRNSRWSSHVQIYPVAKVKMTGRPKGKCVWSMSSSAPRFINVYEANVVKTETLMFCCVIFIQAAVLSGFLFTFNEMLEFVLSQVFFLKFQKAIIPLSVWRTTAVLPETTNFPEV